MILTHKLTMNNSKLPKSPLTALEMVAILFSC
jgi:hypothetical protein